MPLPRWFALDNDPTACWSCGEPVPTSHQLKVAPTNCPHCRAIIRCFACSTPIEGGAQGTNRCESCLREREEAMGV